MAVTDPAISQQTSVEPDRLDTLQQELRAALASEGDDLKECMQRLETEVRARFKKDTLQHVICRIGTTAAGCDHPFAAFNRAMAILNSPPPTEITIRGLLLREKNCPPDELLSDVLVWSLLPFASNDNNSLGEVSSLSPSLLRLLKRQLGEYFPRLGLVVWDRAAERTKHPGWCEAWVGLTRAVLQASVDLPQKSRLDLPDLYAERICQAGEGVALKLAPLLLFLGEMMEPFSEQVTAAIRTAPVGTALQRQMQTLLGGSHIASAASIPPEPGRKKGSRVELALGEFDGLPQPVALAAKSILSYLKSLYASQAVSAEELMSARKDRDVLQEQLREQCESSRMLAEEQSRLGNELTTAHELCAMRQKQIRELEAGNETLRIKLAQIVEEHDGLREQVQSAKDDYERLLSRTDKDIGQVREHILERLNMEIREPWQLMARMLEKVIRADREPMHLASVWNQLDSVLADQLGKPGEPVSMTTT